MKHILIIGGTGMLRQASEYFIEKGNIVTLMACNQGVSFFSPSPNQSVAVMGSATVNPKELSQKDWRDLYPQRYREIFLGYKKHRHSTRWLTDKEISDGTIRALEQDKLRYTVVVVDSWSIH